MPTEDPQTPRYQRLTLDLIVGSDPLSGILHDGEHQRPFTGWLALASALLRASELGRDSA